MSLQKQSRFTKSHQKESKPIINSNNNTSNSTKTCIICCFEYVYGISTLCNHNQICAICAMKMRYLMGDFQCPCCRSNWNTVVVSKNPLPLNSYDLNQLIFDDQIRMYFDDPKTTEYFQFLRAFRCIECEKSISTSILSTNYDLNNLKFPNLHSLSLHLEKVHMKYLCNVCVTELKVLPCQFNTYSTIALKSHKKNGDPAEESSLAIEPHPLCQFCSRLFFNKDTLYYHLTKDHFSCHICEEIQQSQPQNKRMQNYFRNYHSLELHFRKKHFLCTDPECIALRYIVFPDELELQAHMFKKHVMYNYHNKKLSRSQIKKLSQIPIELSYGRSRFQNDFNDQFATIRHDINDDNDDNNNPLLSSEYTLDNNYDKAYTNPKTKIDSNSQYRETSDLPPVWVSRQNRRFVNPLMTPSPDDHNYLKNKLHSSSNHNMCLTTSLSIKHDKSQKTYSDPNSWANILVSGQDIKRNKNKQRIPKNNNNNISNFSMANTASIENFPQLEVNSNIVNLKGNYSSATNSKSKSQHNCLIQGKKSKKLQSNSHTDSTSNTNNIKSKEKDTGVISSGPLSPSRFRVSDEYYLTSTTPAISLSSNTDLIINNDSDNMLNQYNYARIKKKQNNNTKSTESLSLPLIDTSKILPFSLPSKCPKSEILSSNHKLINGVKKSLKNDKFKYDQFKKMSMSFRRGIMSTVDYYDYFVANFSYCQDIYNDDGQNIGSYQLLQLLLYLLPDDDKREELFEVFKNDILLTPKN